MIVTKFSLGERVKHQLHGFIGVVVDVDAVFSLDENQFEGFTGSDSLRHFPWYHVVMVNEQGETVQTYLAEAQLDWAPLQEEYGSQDTGELLSSIRAQMQAPHLRN
ncbi:MAG: Heat shock protein HspQ [Candidatus Erwinia impunctatus]|nr:Heat shock protein HspQ [Culicoides impunctatus]